MTPASRGKAWWGLGLVLVLGIVGGLYLTGVDYESHWGLPECQRGFGAFVLPVS